MNYRVIIIDDEPWTREVIRSLGNWSDLGLDIVGEASDGEYGVELIKQLQPHIVITDINMPKMNGIHLIAEIKKMGSEAQVVIISGHDDFEYIRDALRLGVCDYILKPIKPAELNSQLVSCKEKLSMPFEISATGFLEMSWSDDFNQLKKNVYESLFVDDEAHMIQAFQCIEVLMDCEISVTSQKSDFICVYYLLMLQLQRYINENGYSIKDFFAPNQGSFVFSQDCTAGEMLDFVYKLYAKVAHDIRELQRNRNKLDIGKIKHFIDSNYSNHITLEETANRFFISKEHLSKLFKSIYSMGFVKYLTSVRLEKAKQLILEQDVPIKEVYFMVGYVDQAHFYKKFKRYFGMTPGDMKLTLKIDNKDE